MEIDTFHYLFFEHIARGDLVAAEGMLQRHPRPELFVPSLTVTPVPAGVRVVDWVSLLYKYGDQVLWNAKMMASTHASHLEALKAFADRGFDVDSAPRCDNAYLLDLCMKTRQRLAEGWHGQDASCMETVALRIRNLRECGANPTRRGCQTGLTPREVCDGVPWMREALLGDDGSDVEVDWLLEENETAAAKNSAFSWGEKRTTGLM